MIQHIKCDIFESGADFILHQVNCQGAMNSGIAKQVREKYPWVYEQYRDFCNEMAFPLGSVQTVSINETQAIVNLFAQENFGYDGKCYTDYKSLEYGLDCVRNMYDNKTIAIPYLMGCHRGGGDWNVVYKMIEEAFENYNGDVLICEYNGG